MNRSMRRRLFFLATFLLLTARPASAEEDIPIMEEIIVEEPFDVRLELPSESSVQIMIERMRLRDEAERIEELKIANRNPVTRVLDLTKYSPIPLGASEDRIDTFFFQNALRPDLNPGKDDPLALGH